MGTPFIGKRRAVVFVSGALLASASVLSAGLLEQVNVAGTGTGNHTTIQSAVDAVSDGGVVEIIEAATYTGPVNLPGGKTFTIRGTVPGVISEQLDGGGHWITNGPAGAINVTIEDLTISRDEGTGTAFDIDQRLSDTVTITLNRVTVIHTLTASGGEAIKIDDGANGATGGAATITLNATDCTFTAATTSGSGKSAIRVQSDATDIIDNLVVNLTNCVLSAQNEGVIRSDARNNQQWTLTGCTLSGPDRGFEMDDPHSDCTFTFTDTTITTTGTLVAHAILASDAGCDNNVWTLKRCTFDASASTVNDRLVRVTYPGTSGSSITVENCVFLTNVAGANSRCVEIEGMGVALATPDKAFFSHNTFGAVGASGVVSTGRAITASNSADYNFSNNIFLNFALDNAVAGASSTGVRTGNIFVGPGDESQGGTDRLFVDVSSAPGYPESLAALNLSAGLVPQLTPSPSQAIAFGDPAISVGGVDRAGNTRPQPAATNPDSGAYEVDQGGGSSVGDWQSY